MDISGFISRSRRLLSQHPGFAWLTLGQGLVYLDFEMWYIILPFLVMGFSRSPLWMSVVAAAGYLPLLAGSAPAGWWVDRTSAKTVMITSCLVRAGLSVILGVLGIYGGLTLPMLAVGALLLGFFNTAQTTAKRTIIPKLMGAQNIPLANSVDETCFSCGELAGNLAGGSAVAFIGAYHALLVQAVILLLSATAILRIAEPRPTHAHAARQRTLREGFDFFLTGEPDGKVLLSSLALVVLAYAACMTFFSFQVFYYGSILKINSAAVGWMVFGVSTIGLFGSVLAETLIKRFGVGKTLLIGSAAVTAGLIGVGTLSPLAGVICGAGLVLAGGKTIRVSAATLCHWLVPHELMGRVGGIYSMFAEGTAVLSALATGWVAKEIGLPATFLMASLLSASCWLVYLLTPIRTFNSRAKSQPAEDSGPEFPGEPIGA